MAEKRTTYKIQDIEGIGEVQIADEVVTIIAGLAATEVDGVASMAGNITNELVSKLGMKNLSKGVKVEIVDSVVSVDLTLNIEYGMNILETSKKVQEKVKAAIESYGFTVAFQDHEEFGKTWTDSVDMYKSAFEELGDRLTE